MGYITFFNTIEDRSSDAEFSIGFLIQDMQDRWEKKSICLTFSYDNLGGYPDTAYFTKPLTPQGTRALVIMHVEYDYVGFMI